MSQQNAANAQVNSIIRLVVKADRNDATGMFKTQGGPASYYIRKLASYFGSIQVGAINANVVATPGMVFATGTITNTALAAADTITIGAQTLTAVSSGATANQFNIGGSVTITAANIVTVVNSHAVLSKVVSASSLAGVITLTAVVPGIIGNQIALAISAHGTVSGAFMASGAEGVTATWAKGL